MMIRNSIIVVFLIIVTIESILLFSKKSSATTIATDNPTAQQTDVHTPTTGPNPLQLSKGMKLHDTLISAKAFKLFPGDISDMAKDAMDGWDVKTETLSDGSTQATLTPKGSEDIHMQYIIRPGNSLYFVELNKGDDTDGQDKNLHDDYGVIVDKDGIVQ